VKSRTPRSRPGRHVAGRLGGDRRHHQLHQHLQPLRHAGAGLLAKKAVERGLKVKPWVKTSLAPGSKVVIDYYRQPACSPTSSNSIFTWWASAAPRASAIAAIDGTGDAGGAKGEPGGSGGAQRQPQFRRPRQRAGESQLPGFPALVVAYASPAHGYRPDERSAGQRSERQARLPARHLPSNEEVASTVRQAVGREMFEHEYARAFDATTIGKLTRAGRRDLPLGRAVHLH